MPRKNSGPHLVEGRGGSWEISFTEGGRSRRRATGTPDLRQAQTILAHFLLLTDRDAPTVTKTTVLVNDVLDAYWDEHVLPNVIGKETQGHAITKLRAHFGILPVKAIVPKDVTDYAKRRRSGALGKPSQDGTVARELSVLNAAIHHAVRAKRVTADEAPAIKLPPAGDAKDRWLTHDEADRLLEAALGGRSPKDRLPRVYRFIALALATASRKTAILELTRDQVDMERGTIKLNPTGRRQTKKRRPLVPISDELRPILKRILEETKGDLLLDHAGAVRTAFDNACERAGLTDVTPHTLRHTWATWAAQAGVDLWMIAGVLGDSMATVTKNYLHHTPEHLLAAVNATRRKKA